MVKSLNKVYINLFSVPGILFKMCMKLFYCFPSHYSAINFWNCLFPIKTKASTPTFFRARINEEIVYNKISNEPWFKMLHEKSWNIVKDILVFLTEYWSLYMVFFKNLKNYDKITWSQVNFYLKYLNFLFSNYLGWKTALN